MQGFSGKEKTLTFVSRLASFYGGVGGIRTHGPGRANRFRVCPVMTASIPLRIVPLPHSPGNRREQQERTDYSIRALAARKALRRQDFPAAVFREEFTISSLPRYDRFDTTPYISSAVLSGKSERTTGENRLFNSSLSCPQSLAASGFSRSRVPRGIHDFESAPL